VASQEIERFIDLWEHESGVTKGLLASIPQNQLEYRPDSQGRSIGELAWHIAEIEGIFSKLARERDFSAARPPAVERPRTVQELTSAYERIHREAVDRVRGLQGDDLDREFPFFDRKISVRNVLRFPLLHHQIHHRGQLMMLIRQAGGVPAKVYGPNREDMATFRS
jgi:uncharacterized damage-inducible protein DinB